MYNQHKAAADQFLQELRAVQLKQKEMEKDLASREANVAKFDQQLAQVKTNKEYSALQQEILALKADISLVEEKIILILDDVDKQQKRMNEEKETLKKFEQELVDRKKEIESKHQDITQQIVSLSAERKEILDQLDLEILQQYESILKKRDGMALAPLRGENCGVCQMLLRPQIQDDVKLGRHITTCESCGRILYLDS